MAKTVSPVWTFEEPELPTEAEWTFEDPQAVDMPEYEQPWTQGEIPRKETYEPFSMQDLPARLNGVQAIVDKTGLPYTTVYDFYPLLKKEVPDWKPIQYEGWVNDVGRTIDETPRNLYIGVLTGGAGLANALKREGMRWAGMLGIVPDDIVRLSFEPVAHKEKITAKPPPGILTPKALDTGMMPGAVANQAMAIGLRAPGAFGLVLNAEAQTQQAKNDKITLASSPMARMMRGLSQNVPQYGIALGLGYLTGDSALSLGLLGMMAGGNTFQNQLEAGGSLTKSQFLSDLTMAAEIGGEMLVLPKFIRGFTEGLPIRDFIGLIGLNAGQEGVTEYVQGFLETFGTLTSQEVPLQEAALKAHEAGYKAIPEAMWIGGALAAGPGGIGAVKGQAQYKFQKDQQAIINQANKDIAKIQKQVKNTTIRQAMIQNRIDRGMKELEYLELSEEQAFKKEAEEAVGVQAEEIGTEISKDVEKIEAKPPEKAPEQPPAAPEAEKPVLTRATYPRDIDGSGRSTFYIQFDATAKIPTNQELTDWLNDNSLGATVSVSTGKPGMFEAVQGMRMFRIDVRSASGAMSKDAAKAVYDEKLGVPEDYHKKTQTEITFPFEHRFRTVAQSVAEAAAGFTPKKAQPPAAPEAEGETPIKVLAMEAGEDIAKVTLQDTPTTPESEKPIVGKPLGVGIVKPPHPPTETLSKEWYEENQKQKKTLQDALDRVGSIAKKVVVGIDKAAGSTSTRVFNINPEAGRKLRRYEFDQKMRVMDWGERITPFLKSIHKMDAKDRNTLDLALKNAQGEKIFELTEKHGITEQYEEARAVFNEIYGMADSVGIDMGFQPDYWPRVLKNPEGFLRHLQKDENWSIIERAIKKRAEKAGRTVESLTIEEKAQIANTLMRGYRTQQITLSLPGAAMERQVDIVTSDLNKFYATPTEASMQYIHQMADKVGQREFFGRETKLITKLRGLQSQRLTRLAKYEQEGDSDNPRAVKMQEAYDASQERLERLVDGGIEQSIGAHLVEMVNRGKITPTQEIQLRDLLHSRFMPGRMGSVLGGLRTAAYIDVLNSPLQALTQLDEFAYSVYRGKLRSIPAAIRAVAGESKVTARDIGITSIGAEFEETSFRKALSLQLKATGFEKIDRLNKDIYINTALSQMQAQARQKVIPQSLMRKLERVFGNKADKVAEELKAPITSIDDVSDNVKYLLFNELLDIQPVALSEMPEYYNKSNNGRMLYTLKTFYLKRLDVFRRDAFQIMKSKGTFAEGLSNMVWLATSFAFLGAGSDFLKDYIKGKEFDLKDSVVDNLFRIGMFSKYQVRTVQTEGPGAAISESLFPPTKTLDAIVRDITTVAQDKDRPMELWRSVPVGGELYYWWIEKPKYETSNIPGLPKPSKAPSVPKAP